MHLEILFSYIFGLIITKSSGVIAFQISHHRFSPMRRSTRSMLMNVRVSTYNVLSSHLGGTDYYQSCNPKFLESSYRYNKLIEKMEKETKQEAVICLQEVSTTWANSLHVYFAERGYYMVTGLYGNKFNGYMGVGLAVPLKKFEILDVDTTRIAETKGNGPKKAPVNAAIKIINNLVIDPLFNVFENLGVFKKVATSVWDETSRRSNQMVSARLRNRLGNYQPFVVGTYHMPCMFKRPDVMMVHCSLAAKHLHRFAKEDPYVLAGDFNITPPDAMYRLLTEGSVPAGSPELPLYEAGDNWRVDLAAPLRSAYKEANGKEPEFTNWAKVKTEPDFIDTLDYIFLSSTPSKSDWSVDGVDALPNREAVAGPLPSEDEPSDHILLAANLRLEEKNA